MINEKCNLKCPYCFADEFVNKTQKEMSLDDFSKALDFALSSGFNEKIGLIGGEPTLHSRFRDILIKIIDDPRVRSTTVFTNGIETARYVDELSPPKFHLLINCNSPNDMKQERFEELRQNIDLMIRKRYMIDRVTLGINMYKPDFGYDYILELLREYKMKTVRTSVSVPNSVEYVKSPLRYFKIMKPRVLEFFEKLAENGITPFFDCNAMPLCIWSMEERRNMAKMFKGQTSATNLFNMKVSCSPVIDILPDLTIIRCFGLSDYTKKSMLDFDNISEARGYYQRTIDAFSCNVYHSDECGTCKQRNVGNCSGGCFCFNIESIGRLRRLCGDE